MPSDMLYWRRSSALTPARAGPGLTPVAAVAPPPRTAGAGGEEMALVVSLLAGEAREVAGASEGRSATSASFTLGAGRCSGTGKGLAAGALTGAGSRRGLACIATLRLVAGLSSRNGNTLTALNRSAA